MKKFTQKIPDKNRKTTLNRWLGWLTFCMMLLMGSTGLAQTIQLGSGVETQSNLPMNYNWGYNYSQTIYTAAEMTTAGAQASGGIITSIRFKPTAGVSTVLWKDWVIYMGNTTKDNFATTTDWVALGNLMQVFSGEIIANTTANSWIEVTLNTPFVWDGTNIVVAIDENTANYGGNPLWASYTLAPTSGNKGIYYRSDSTNPNPSSPPTASGRSNVVAQIQFDGSLMPVCTSTPSAGVAVLTPGGGNSGSTFMANATGVTSASGLAFQWQKLIEGTWQDIAGATSKNSQITAETGSVGSTTDYRLKVTCTASGLSAFSTPASYTIQLVYCTPTYSIGCTSGDRISNVTLQGESITLDNTSLCSTAAYGNYTGLSSPDLAPGNTYAISVSTDYTGPTYEQVKAWIDYNGDGVFSESELIANTNNAGLVGGTTLFNFTVPTGIISGDYRMRVRLVYGTTPVFDACSAGATYGEIEDYTINIIQLDNCIGTPTAGTVTSPIFSCANESFTLSTLGATAPADGLTGIWQSSPAGMNDWTNITGATSVNYTMTNGVASNTDFRYTMTCSHSNETDTSGTISVIMNAATDCYCIPAGTSTTNYITDFTTTGGAINISNLDSELSANGYGDFTFFHNVTQDVGGTVNFEAAMAGTTTSGFKIWIDFNQNGSFDDDGEVVYTSNSSLNTRTGSFVVPFNALEGQTRMRIGNSSTPNTGPANPCMTNLSGEYEDYMFTVTIPSCMPVGSLSTSNLTANSVDLGWISDGTTFDISWGAGSFDAENGTIVPFVSGATLSGLNADTAYQFYVRQNCGTEESVWAGPFSFTTLCDAITNLPYIQNFDIYGTGSTAFPNCWERPVIYSGYPSIVAVSTVLTSAPNSLRFQSEPANPTYAISPPFAEDIHNLRVKFKLRREGPNSGTIAIGVMSDPNDTSTFELVQTIVPGDNNSNFYEYEVYLNATTLTGGNNHIAFRHNSVSSSWYYWLDDFVVELIPSCVEPADLAATDQTIDTAVLSWTSDGTLFDIELVEEGTVPTGTPTHTGVANSFTAINLTPSTSYEFYVRQDCGTVNGVSIWVGPFRFTTECLPPNITGTTPGEVCGEGEVTLSATADAGTIAWYANETGGTKLSEGASFTTPSITETTSYWVSTFTGASANGGKIAPNTGATASSINNWGIRFTLTEEVTLTSVDVYSTSAGTLNVKITDNNGVELYETGNVSIVNGGIATPNVIPLSFTAPAGDYRILIKSYSGANIIRDNSNLSFPYVSDDGIFTATISEWGGTTAANYYYFYNIGYLSGCSSARTEVIATVTDAPDFELSQTTLEICEGNTSDAVTITTGASDYDTFEWTPSLGVSGDATTGWSFDPTETTTYLLSASQSTGAECMATFEVQVNVNPLPTAITVVVSETEVCDDTIIALSVTGNINNGTAILGDGTTAPTSTANEPNPLSAFYGGTKHQMLYTAAELTAQGMMTGSVISEVTFDLNTFAANACANFTIRMGATTVNVMSSSFISGTTTVYGPATFTPSATGLVTFELTTPYVWDGTSNLVVETVHNAGNSGNGSGSNTKYTTTPSNSVAYLRADNTNNGIAGFDALTTTPTFSNKRPNMTFTYTLEQTAITWSPATNLFTDAAATTAYVADDYATAVYFKSDASGTMTYTATSHTDEGCSVDDSIEITVNETPDAPVATSPQMMNEGQTIADIIVTGDNLTWYTDEDLTNEVDASTVLTEGLYTFYVTASLGNCTSEATEIMVEVTLSTKDFDAATFKAYPNPVKDYFTISYSKDIQNIAVINMLGQTIFTKTVNTTDTQIDMTSLPTGTYFVKVNVDGAVKTIKVVKQ